LAKAGGEGGIRTPGELAPTAVFKTAALDHSATSPVMLLKTHGETVSLSSFLAITTVGPWSAYVENV
jgi:hypothetical protein